MKFIIVGLGYVGIANAVLLAQYHEVIGIDLDPHRVDSLNKHQSPIFDPLISQYLVDKELNLTASTDLQKSLPQADYVIISTPTNYDPVTHSFDTSSVEQVIEEILQTEPKPCIIVKSTIPVGFVDSMREKFETNQIFFSPEFLREGSALADNLYPSRIIVGDDSQKAKQFARILQTSALKENIPVLMTGTREAEAIKLFANTYLAMRVSYVNEIDTYALSQGLDSEQIITGISLDNRIGNHYNNPSFGYGGYCLPKDTKQLLANFKGIPQDLITAIVASNETRQLFLAKQIINQSPNIVGIHRLGMKHGSDNFRTSAILQIMQLIKRAGIPILIYEPTIPDETYDGNELEHDINVFKKRSDIILTNRMSKVLEDVTPKIFTCDIFNSD